MLPGAPLNKALAVSREESTSIHISKKTKERMKSKRLPFETYDAFINRMLDEEK